jgi:cytochrome c
MNKKARNGVMPMRIWVGAFWCVLAVPVLAQSQGQPPVQAAPRVWVTPPAGDIARGKALYQERCTACHAVDAHRIGPMHRGVFGRRVGGAPDYTYSAELAASRLRWTAQTLNVWLADPEDLVPGQRMGFQVDDAQERADLIAWLATLTAGSRSSSP